jgi:Tol biopolymer transport system component/DNA-binding winged helix-turn-helix (wHTH) protein
METILWLGMQLITRDLHFGVLSATAKWHMAPVSSYQFGRFELDLLSYELKHDGQPLRLEKIPMELLIFLVEHHGTLITRDQIIEKLWGKQVFLDTEQGINTAIRKVRQVLQDEPEKPQFLETVVGKGYRFTGNVRAKPPDSPPPHKPLTPEVLGGVPIGRRLLAIGVVALGLLSAGAIWRFHRVPVEPPVEVVPLTGLSGYEVTPSFSPDGNEVAFVLRGSNNPGIYTALVEGEKSFHLTGDPGDRYPKWSPDGRHIAFSRPSPEGQAIYLIPALGGTEHRVYSGPASFFPRSLDWSPDGKCLAFSEARPDRTHARISLLSLADSSVKPLTFPSGQDIDYAPAFSPDGSTVAFVRSIVTGNVSELYVVPVKGGEPKRLTFANRGISNQLTWTADGAEIVFSSDSGGADTLWRISASGGTPRPVAGVGPGAESPAISPKGDQLAYEHSLQKYGVWRLTLRDIKHGQGMPMQVVSAKGLYGRPDFAPDGKKIAFESDRLGHSEIWVCESDGSNCGQLTSLHGVAGAARWSPDGRYIAFEFRPKDHSEVFVVEVPGGRPRLLPTLPGSDNGGPNWSRDGKWIYFCSDKGGGPLQLWKVPLQGGPPVQVTRNGGVFAAESVDGRFIYYSKFEVPGLWKMPMEGGAETMILDEPDGSDWFNWEMTAQGIYFLDSSTEPATIKFYEFATAKQFAIFTPTKQTGSGLAIAPDGTSLLYVQVELAESSVMLVKNFH